MRKTIKNVRPDSKGRILLGKLAKGFSSFDIQEIDYGEFIVKAKVEIPAKEKWLYENKEAMKKVKRGIEQAEKGKMRSRGKFSKYLDDDEK
ncbi:hypothetical protein ACFLZV_06730 [Candidatus Margulisiibacteriota bacterium]